MPLSFFVQKPMVVLVEDDPALRRTVARMIERLGFSVTPVANASEGLTALDTLADVDLLVTDYHLPDGTGVELAIAAVRRRPNLQVVVASGSVEDEVPTAGIPPANLRGVLPRPFGMEELRAMLGDADPS